MILVSTDYISGKELEMLGLVKGSTIQSRNVGRDITQGFKTLVGGELKAYTEMMNEARAIATKRMVEEAEKLGADAVVNIRYASAAVLQGAAEVMGFRLMDNFCAPYFAESIGEFWRRWHISLSTWFRDYLYIPLGGNRKGKFRTYVNNFLTMVLGGLWHGASWMYIIWGAYHGLLLAVHKMLRNVWRLPEPLKGNFVIRFVNMAVTFVLVVAGFTLFRAPSLETVGDMAVQMWSDFHVDIAGQFVESYMMIVAAMGLGYLMHFTPKSWTTGTVKAYNAMPIVIQSIFLAAILFLVIQTRQSELVPFVYLQY